MGVKVHLSEAQMGVVTVRPKRSRVDKIVTTCVSVLQEGKVELKCAKSLPGVLRFTREACFGRLGARVLRELAVYEQRAGGILNKNLREGLEWLICYLPVAPPRRIEARSSRNVVHIFTDGACEPEAVTAGAVLFAEGCRPEAFGTSVPEGWCHAGGAGVGGRSFLRLN